ncbi:Na+/H+ antiporter subunit B [Desulfurivibrio sp. D14AmB]|uniref:Na+/H+ antiporter subunit B n=1 Tax=Desulfurivibrio sp. D14AmB TaxID=3374370 RepID=UPI00376ED4BA
MPSLILRTATLYLMPMLLLLSAFLLLRGHYLPGGGFAGGLLAATTFSLHCLANSAEETRRLLRVPPISLAAIGLLLAALSGSWSLLAGEPFLTGQWVKLEAGVLGQYSLGTPLLFDLGIYLVVIGATLAIVLTLAEEE